MNTIGITERGDAALDYTWTEKIQDTDYSVIITKNTTSERFHKAVLEHKDKILLHATITGWGGTEVEPNVPKPHETVASIIKLIQEGFPANQIVYGQNRFGCLCSTAKTELLKDTSKSCPF